MPLRTIWTHIAIATEPKALERLCKRKFTVNSARNSSIYREPVERLVPDEHGEDDETRKDDTQAHSGGGPVLDDGRDGQRATTNHEEDRHDYGHPDRFRVNLNGGMHSLVD